MSYGYDARRRTFTGKVRDSETGLDDFGARYMSVAQGRFTGPDTSSSGIVLADPQTWNPYSYVQNRPLAFVDRTGKWAAPVHADISTIALQGFLSVGELQAIVDQQYTADLDQSPAHSYRHAMSDATANPPQQAAEAAYSMWGYVANNIQEASITLHSDKSFSDLSLVYLGDAIHTVQDYTSPKHTDSAGQ